MKNGQQPAPGAKETVPAETPASANRPGRKKRRIWPFLLMAAVLLLAFPLLLGKLRGGSAASAVRYLTAPVERRDIVKTLTGNGALKPADSYSVNTLLEGQILSADFQEGDRVDKDGVLYELDSSSARSAIEQAERSLEQAELSLESARRSQEQARRSYADSADNQNVRADISGVLVRLDVKEGDAVSPGQSLALIRDSAVMRLKVPFPSDDAARFWLGQAATVTLDGSFETLAATVAEISGAESVGTGNMLTRDVTFEVRNPGALTAGQAASAAVEGLSGAGSAVFTYRAERTVTAAASGKVTGVSVSEGDAVEAGQVLLTLGGAAANTVQSAADAVASSADSVRSAEIGVENARLSLENARDRLEDYVIRSPIRGTVVQKDYKAGDRVSAGKTLCTIYDLSYLTMTLNVDELDISSVSVGQTVTVTAEALPGKSFDGVVTRVSVAGTTVGGVTSYPVTVRLDETAGLLPGMNADALLRVSERKQALSVPNQAVSRGNLVLVTDASPSAASPAPKEAPAGYVYVQVDVGISDDDYTEILSGLTEADTVAYLPADTATDLMMAMFGPGMDEGPDGGGPGE